MYVSLFGFLLRLSYWFRSKTKQATKINVKQGSKKSRKDNKMSLSSGFIALDPKAVVTVSSAVVIIHNFYVHDALTDINLGIVRCATSRAGWRGRGGRGGRPVWE